MSLSKQLQNSHSIIYVNGIYIYIFSTATALEDEEQQLQC